MALPNPADGDTIQATDVSDIKNHLEGGSGKTAPYHLKMSSGSFQITLADNAGATKFRLNDSDGIEVFSVNSDGGVTFSASPTFATLVLPQSAAPTPTVEGQIYWDTDDNTIKIGDSAATKEFGYLGSTTPSALGTAAAGTSKEVSHVDHVHSGATFKWTAATQTVSASTGFVDVVAVGSPATMTFTPENGGIYRVEYDLPLTFTGTGGAKFQVVGGTVTAVSIRAVLPLFLSADNAFTFFAATTALSTPFGGANAGASSANTYNSNTNGANVRIIMYYASTSTTAVTLQYAQNSANGTTVIGVGATMRMEKIN